MAEPILRIEGLKKRQNSGFVLDIPHLEFLKGKVYSIIGPNGAGKTTLLNILNLLDKPNDGEVFFGDKKVTPANSLEVRRRMGMVMENPYLFHTSVYKNITIGLKYRFADKGMWEAVAKEALQMVGLGGFEERYAPELSSGESQRVAIARILAFRPEVLFLDEPFSNIDREHVNILEGLIKIINEKYQTTIIFTTHDLGQAKSLADEVISIVGGNIADISPLCPYELPTK